MDDKKKIAILATLFIVMIGIGAFQFVKSGSPAPSAETAAKHEATAPAKTADTKIGDPKATTGSEQTPTGEATKAEGVATAQDPSKADTGQPQVDPALIVAAKLDARDPFDGRKWDKSIVREQPIQPIKQPRETYRPRAMEGALRPLAVDPGNVQLPGADPKLQPADGKMPSIDDFQWSVSGTMDGSKPCAVFTDSTGKQKLVPVGGSIDGDSQLLSISKGKVTVSHRGKTKTFTVGGITPSDKKPEGN